MFVNQYRIHFVNGQVISVAECVEEDNEMSSDLIDRFMEETGWEFTIVATGGLAKRIVPLCRHEILNEINKEEIYEDVADWIEKRI